MARVLPHCRWQQEYWIHHTFKFLDTVVSDLCRNSLLESIRNRSWRRLRISNSPDCACIQLAPPKFFGSSISPTHVRVTKLPSNDVRCTSCKSSGHSFLSSKWQNASSITHQVDTILIWYPFVSDQDVFFVLTCSTAPGGRTRDMLFSFHSMQSNNSFLDIIHWHRRNLTLNFDVTI